MAWERRTEAQKEANSLDLDIYRLANRLEYFGSAYLHGSDSLATSEAAAMVRGLRSLVRQHMHPKDREETVG